MDQNNFYKKRKGKLLVGLATLFLGPIEGSIILILEIGILTNMIEDMIFHWCLLISLMKNGILELLGYMVPEMLLLFRKGRI